MATRNPHVTYFTDVKKKIKALEQTGASDHDEIPTREQERAEAELQDVLASYLLDNPIGPVNRRGLNTLSRNGYPAGDISGQPSNEESDGAYHVGAVVRVGDKTVVVERDDC